MSTDYAIGIYTPRQNLVNGAVMAFEMAAVRGEMSWWNAECNIDDLDRVFPNDAELGQWCEQVGIEPLAELPPKQGPGFPHTHPRLRHWRTGSHAQPHHSWREYEGGPCEHRWIVLQSGGYDCNDCFQHFGMWD